MKCAVWTRILLPSPNGSSMTTYTVDVLDAGVVR
jgi:hypothetical protein